MMFIMVKERKNGKMDLHFKDNMHKERKMDLAFINGLTQLCTKETGPTIKCAARELILGMMGEFTQESG